MKTFLIATDFSEASRNATRYGLEMAEAFNAKAVLINAYLQAPVALPDSMMVITPSEMKVIEKEQLEEEADLFARQKGIHIGIISVPGPSVTGILATAKETKADLIIAGMKGKGKAIRRVMGSTATKLATKTRTPLLIIPEGASYIDPKAIALANDIKPDADIHLLDTLRKVVEKFHPKFYIVRVVRKRSEEVIQILNWSAGMDRMVKDLDPVYEYPLDKNVSHALTGFISSHHIDMLAVIPHRHSILEKLLRGSETRRMIFVTKIPLLILPDMRHELEI